MTCIAYFDSSHNSILLATEHPTMCRRLADFRGRDSSFLVYLLASAFSTGRFPSQFLPSDQEYLFFNFIQDRVCFPSGIKIVDNIG